MSLLEVRQAAIAPALELLPERMSRNRRLVEVLLLAIHLQEAPNQEQRQIGGPAVGIWQFEEGGGIAGVLRHPASRPYALIVCKALGVEPTKSAVYAALQSTDDVLDAAFARLLLWTDRQPLPVIGDVAGAWELYLRTWRPGAFSRGSKKQREALRRKWSVNYAKAMDMVAGQ